MDAQTLNCPMCGAPAAPDATQCDHCGARLATVACPSCFGLIFQGAKFCSHCGAQVDQPNAATAASRQCPHCKVAMNAVTLGTTSFLECNKCEGLWVDTGTFQQICADREKQAAVLGMPGSQPHPQPHALAESEPCGLPTVHYYPCPVCDTLMNRVNFAHCSHVIVNVCMQHGTWFEKDELRKIIEFIRAGGLEKARVREIDELEAKRSTVMTSPNTAIPDFSTVPAGGSNYDLYGDVLHAVGSVLWGLLK